MDFVCVELTLWSIPHIDKVCSDQSVALLLSRTYSSVGIDRSVMLFRMIGALACDGGAAIMEIMVSKHPTDTSFDGSGTMQR